MCMSRVLIPKTNNLEIYTLYVGDGLDRSSVWCVCVVPG